MSLETCIASVMGRRWLTILLSVLVMLALAAGAQNLVSVDVDVRNHFKKNDPHIIALDHLEETYAISDTALIAVAPQSGTIFTQEALIAIEELTEQLWRTPYVTRVDSIANYSHSQGFEDELIVEPLIDDAGSLSDDDIGRTEEIALNTEEVAGRFVSRDGRVAGLVVSIALPEDRDDRQLAKIEVVDYLYDTAAEARAKHSTIDYHITGELALNRAMGDALNKEFELLGPIALGIMLLVAVLVLRSIWGTVAIVLMIIAVIIAAVGFVGWTGMTLFGESAAAIFVLMAIAVAHSVHVIEAMLAGLREGMDRKQAAIHSMELNVWPVFLTSITTSIGFLSLNFSEMPPFQVMGNMVAFGSLFAFLFAVTFLPAVLSYLPMRVRPVAEGRTDYFDRLGRFVVSRRVILLCSFGVLTVALMAGISRIELKENWLELLGESYQ
ncbi:MAG: MMPL family transporter, partial [Gammaproteobacteria bacterium]|nr:MMPL family transporter [Gammaproteobacteria bacterium]